MGAMIDIDGIECGEFFAPVPSDFIDSMIGQYRKDRAKIEYLASVINGGEYKGAIRHFAAGNKIEGRYVSVDSMFDLPGALDSLNSEYWSKTLELTDVLDCMPQKRRDDWSLQLTSWRDGHYKRGKNPAHDLPEYEESTVRSTIESLLASRQTFFSERVDGIFRGLSGEHVTNSPTGFNRRMIISGVTDSFSMTSSSRCGLINDLRAVIAKFMGRDEPHYNSSNSIVSAARRNTGQWMLVDGGALRIRVYMKGTAHLEVHPDMAYRLNQVLAHLYPMAIASEFRTKPKKPHKEFQMIGRPLPFAVINVIADLRRDRYSARKFTSGYSNQSNAVKDEASRIIAGIGGVKIDHCTFEFDYDAQDAIDEIVTSGCVPDRVSHQYYPTPENVALAAIDIAEIGPDDQCLEPSAGQGGIAQCMPKDRTICVEISELHCKILQAKGFHVEHADFLQWRAGSFNCIVLNPPYSEGRWQSHIEHASTMLRTNGRLIAVLPASAKGKDVLPGFTLTWSRVFDNEFAGTSTSVVIMKAIKA